MGKIQKKRKITQKLRQNEGLSNIKINRYKNDYATHRGDTVKENEEYYDYVRDQAARDQEDEDDDENYNYYEEDYGNYDSNYQNDQPTTISNTNDRTTNKITFYIEEIKENNIKHDNNNNRQNNYYGNILPERMFPTMVSVPKVFFTEYNNNNNNKNVTRHDG